MALPVERTASSREYNIKDMSQANFGRLEIKLAELQMPSLMACRSEFGPSQPLKGARITGSIHVTIQTAILIETLTTLGAEVRWCSGNMFEDVVSEADIFVVTTGGSEGIIMVHHMRKMKNNAIVCNMGRFYNAIDMPGLENFPGVNRVTINPQTDRWVFPDTKSGVIVLAEGRLVNLGRATGHPSLATSCSFTNHAMVQLELWMERGTGKYEKKVYVLPKHLDEKVASLHLGKLGAKLTELSKEHAD